MAYLDGSASKAGQLLSCIGKLQVQTLKTKTMKQGTVKFFNEVKGFGFIKVDGSNEEIFVHVTGLKDQIREADVVSFDVTEGKKGLSAINVKRV